MESRFPPGPALPAWLQTLVFFRRPFSYLDACHRRWGDHFTIRIMGTGRMVYLSDPADVRTVFRGDPEVFHAGEANAPLVTVLGPHSVLATDGDEHTRGRKLMAPAFHGESVARLVDVMAEVAAAEVARWPVGRAFAAHPRMRAVTLEVILRAVIGADQPGRIARLRRVLPPLMDLRPIDVIALLRPGLRRYWPWSRQLRVQRAADRVLYDEIARTRTDPRLAERNDVLAMLVRGIGDGPGTDEELRDHLVTLLLAGHETTATAMSWTLEQLVRSPAVLERARDAAARGDDAYLDATIAESLRRRPVASEVVRRLTRPTEIGGYRLPAGTVLAVGTTLVQRDAANHADAGTFDPERYLGRRPDPITWFPFGGGVRRCVGAGFASVEMRVVLAEILRRVELAPVTGAAETPRRRHVTIAPGRGARVMVLRHLDSTISTGSRHPADAPPLT